MKTELNLLIKEDKNTKYSNKNYFLKQKEKEK